ncbi:hypothetical protein SLE2022_236530 [Rubroshorea leprosula]
MVATLREMATNFQKLDCFDGGNFIRWQRKMHIFLTTLNIGYVLTDARPEKNENETLQDTRKRKKEIEKLLNSFKQYDMKMDESIVVSSIIDKLPQAWKDFKRTLKHKKEDISLENLANSLRLEEQNRAENEKELKVQVSDVHVLEEGTSS